MAKSMSVAVALDRALSEFSEEENEILFKCMSKAMKKCKADVKAASPPQSGGSGEYARGWSVRTKRLKYGFQGIIYNRTKPQLTHLLENGHVVKPDPTRPGRKHRVNGIKHIGPARDMAEEYLVELLEEAHL